MHTHNCKATLAPLRITGSSGTLQITSAQKWFCSRPAGHQSHASHLPEVYSEARAPRLPFRGCKSPCAPRVRYVATTWDNPRPAQRLEPTPTLPLKFCNDLIQRAHIASKSAFTVVFTEGYIRRPLASQRSQFTSKLTILTTWESHLYFR